MSESVPKGYKRTEIGVIPEEWEVKQVGDIASIDPEILTASTQPTYQFNYIEIENVETGRLIGYSKQIFQSSPSRARKVIRANDILVATVRPYLKSHLFFTEQGNEWVCSTGFTVIRVFPEFAVSYYIFSHFMFDLVNRQIALLVGGSNYPAISSNDIRKLIVPLPPLPEQRAIAEALSDIDSLLAALDRLIAKKRAVKQAVMHDLLTGKVRLPGFEGEWKTKKLGETFTLEYGKSQKGIVTPDGIYPILATSGEVGRTNQFLYDRPSIIIGRKGTIDTPRYVDVPFWTIDTTFYAIIRDEYFPKFLFYLLTTINWQRYNEASGVPSLNANTIYAIQVTLPASLTEQTAIAAVLSDLDEELTALERERAKWHAIKQGMMNDLLTGKVRLVQK